MKLSMKHLVIISLLFYLHGQNLSASDNMVIIIIDGARYSETFGDINHQFIPNMWNMSAGGTIIDEFYNDSMTYTSKAIPALWCGTWTETVDTVNNGYDTQYAVKPSIFEYYRKQKNIPIDKCYYVLKYITSLWLPSFDPDYGPDYWQTLHSEGSTDSDVSSEALQIMDACHPGFLLIYLADVDSRGHSGDWNAYTNSIQITDSIVAVIWNKIQSDSFYKDNTNLFVTNDHGRHDDDHGGFRGHGCGCDGCRHIMFLAMGPEIKENYISNQYRRIPDMAVTACHLLDVNSEKATGEIMAELFEINAISDEQSSTIAGDFSITPIYPNPFNPYVTIEYALKQPDTINISIYNYLGQPIITLVNSKHNSGYYQVKWNGLDNREKPVSSGIYICVMQTTDQTQTRKLLLQK
ncbi:T9SS type A sorting domain-containing protein [bacterium]|nr:T9SS type A sorting domain-containing protein [bacterium]MBU1873726.1 T9SS type A sorting domain-containing protein [bacterium]